MTTEDRGFGRGWVSLDRDIGLPGEGAGSRGYVLGPAVPDRVRDDGGFGAGVASPLPLAGGDGGGLFLSSSCDGGFDGYVGLPTPSRCCFATPAAPRKREGDCVAYSASSGPSRGREGDCVALSDGSVRHDAFTAARRMVFLDHLAREGSVLAACAAAGVSRQSAYVARRRDHAFARGWDAALVLAREHVADVLASRALHGVEEDVFYHGERIATRRRFDTRLLLAHLARLDNLADATVAGEDAARFDELVAIVGGVRPAEDLFDIVGDTEDEEVPVLPLPRAVYAGRIAMRADFEDAYDARHAGDAEDGSGVEDADRDEAEDLAGGQWLADVRVAAEAEWDGWFHAACAAVDAAVAGLSDGAPDGVPDAGPDAGPDEDGAGAPVEFKSLANPPMDRVNRVNFGRDSRLALPGRRWYAGGFGMDAGGRTDREGQGDDRIEGMDDGGRRAGPGRARRGAGAGGPGGAGGRAFGRAGGRLGGGQRWQRALCRHPRSARPPALL